MSEKTISRYCPLSDFSLLLPVSHCCLSLVVARLFLWPVFLLLPALIGVLHLLLFPWCYLPCFCLSPVFACPSLLPVPYCAPVPLLSVYGCGLPPSVPVLVVVNRLSLISSFPFLLPFPPDVACPLLCACPIAACLCSGLPHLLPVHVVAFFTWFFSCQLLLRIDVLWFFFLGLYLLYWCIFPVPIHCSLLVEHLFIRLSLCASSVSPAPRIFLEASVCLLPCCLSYSNRWLLILTSPTIMREA